MSARLPKYRLHRGSGQALVQIDGQRIYLGKHGTAESKEKYRRVVGEWLAANKKPATGSSTGRPIANEFTVNELLLAFWPHAQKRYVKNGKPTSEIRSFGAALRPVRELYGREFVSVFGPLALVACRQKLIDAGICRTRINGHVTRIRHVFKWGVSRELVPETVWRALCAVDGLRFGEAIETEPVRPVPERNVEAIEMYVTPQVWAMVQFQLWTGCRPSEACVLRMIDLKMEGEIWEYRPHSHKTQHHAKERVIFIGPNAQEVIRPWLKTDLHAYLFSPREARAWFDAERTRKRITPMTPSQRARKRKANPKRVPGEFYTITAYDHAIDRACKRARVPSWAPNQLRHNAGTRIRAEFGIDAARAILGHSSPVTTEIYAEIDRDKAREIMRKIG